LRATLGRLWCTYGIVDILPYIRSTSPPCSSHTGTRLALSWIGVWSLGNSTKAVAITPADRAAAEGLRVATSATSTEYAQESAASAAATREMKAKGVTTAIRQKLIRSVNDAIAAWQRIKSPLDLPSKATDAQLIDARKSLSTYLGYLITTDHLLLSGASGKDINAQYGSKLQAIYQHLRYLAFVIEARYPQVKDWSFLPAK
jgi:hypothetical protein